VLEQERQREAAPYYQWGCLCSNWCTSSIVQVWNTPLTADEVGKLADYAKRTDAKWGVTKWAIIAGRTT